ncbi:MAG: hypothetical protein IIW54_11680 [Lachnospiraceae bacterium]|nr:hypothetical protein [Lachnospiraceae bacterium]
MKSALKAICLLFMAGVIAMGYYFAADGGVTYRFEETERIDNYTDQLFTTTVGKVAKNDTEAAKQQEFKNISTTQTYKCNVKLVQAEWRLIEDTIGVKFTKSYKKTIDSISGTVAPNNYSWVEFTPEMTKVSGYLIKDSGGKETKTYVEIVYPKADAQNAAAPAGKVEFKNSAVKPAEKLS